MVGTPAGCREVVGSMARSFWTANRIGGADRVSDSLRSLR
jgi:hypothetical protein